MEKDRDYIAEMDACIEYATRGSGWVAAIVAEKVCAELAERDPQLLEGWLREMAADTLKRQIQARYAGARLREHHRVTRGAFADQARIFEEGKDENGARLLGMFALVHVVSAGDIRKRAGEMTGEDHLFVAERYHTRGTSDLMRAAFHRAVADKVGDRRTDEAMDLAEYESLYRSLARTAAE